MTQDLAWTMRLATPADRDLLHNFYRVRIPEAYRENGLLVAIASADADVVEKQRLFDDPNAVFLLGFMGAHLLATASLTAVNDLIGAHLDEPSTYHELGSVYVHPDIRGQGIARQMIQGICHIARQTNRMPLVFDAGFPKAIATWTHVFGPPQILLADYWGKHQPHAIWIVHDSKEVFGKKGESNAN